MATPSLTLINALRATADIIQRSEDYQWGYMGACNCGFLAQTITSLSKAEIHAYAMRKSGDWADQVNDYCPFSGMPFDLLVSEMIQVGFTTEDLKDLERLSNDEILNKLPSKNKYLKHNQKEDVVVYMKIWADLLEEQLVLQEVQPVVFEEEMIIY